MAAKTRLVRVGLVAVLLLAWPASGAWAFTPLSGTNVTVSQPVHDDLYAAGGTVTVTAPTDGDVVVAAGSSDLAGPVGGGVLAAGGTVRISGPVDRSVRAAAGTLLLAAHVGSDAVLAGVSVITENTVEIGRDLAIGGGNVSVSGTIQRNARISGGDVTIGGSIGGDAEIRASRVVLLPTARIGGKLRYAADQPAQVQPGAQVGSGIERLPLGRGARPSARPVAPPGFWLGVRLVEMLALIAFGLVALAVAPRGAAAVARQVGDGFWVSLLTGFVLLVTVPVATLLLALTLIAVPLSAVAILLYLATLYPGQVFVAAWLGDRIVRAVPGARNTRLSRNWVLVIGTVVLVLLYAIPYAGWIVRLAAMLIGFGAIWLSLWAARSARPQAPAPPPPAPA